MPEGDAVWRAAKRLHDAFAGDVLTRSDFRWPSLATSSLVGARTIEVVPRGKHMLHRVEVTGRGTGDGFWTLHSHFKMDGSWRIQPTRTPAQRFRRHTVRAIIGSARNTAVGNDLKMLDLVRTADEHRLVGHLGPDLLGPDWDATRAQANLAADDRPIGAALLDQRNLAGIGTMWCAETLWAEQTDPWTPSSALPPDRLGRIVARAHRLLMANQTTRFPNSTGHREPSQALAAYRRLHQPCRRCGSPITAGEIGTPPQQRTLFFCPECQVRSALRS